MRFESQFKIMCSDKGSHKKGSYNPSVNRASPFAQQVDRHCKASIDAFFPTKKTGGRFNL
jgi:hypothetical protein